jgi:hypothetical protein
VATVKEEPASFARDLGAGGGDDGRGEVLYEQSVRIKGRGVRTSRSSFCSTLYEQEPEQPPGVEEEEMAATHWRGGSAEVSHWTTGASSAPHGESAVAAAAVAEEAVVQEVSKRTAGENEDTLKHNAGIAAEEMGEATEVAVKEPAARAAAAAAAAAAAVTAAAARAAATAVSAAGREDTRGGVGTAVAVAAAGGRENTCGAAEEARLRRREELRQRRKALEDRISATPKPEVL